MFLFLGHLANGQCKNCLNSFNSNQYQAKSKHVTWTTLSRIKLVHKFATLKHNLNKVCLIAGSLLFMWTRPVIASTVVQNQQGMVKCYDAIGIDDINFGWETDSIGVLYCLWSFTEIFVVC